ncbi:MAG: protein kinase, partial [Rhodopirellula sp. JB053]
MPESPRTYDFLEPSPHEGDLGMLGTYRILGEMGRGGMGYVFRAEDTVLERAVALKVMNRKIASTPNSRDRFLQEARAMAAVHHDNVVVIFEVGTHEGTPFMAMELLRGETLEAVNARKDPVDYERVINYARQICRGLAAAHAKGIVHRDIKPANIWVEEGTERIKILDFGLALAQSPAGDSTGVGSVCGTPGYLTPEQARSDPLDDRSDLYSLGVVLYEMCTGKLPTAQPAIAEQLVALLTRDPQPVRELNPDIPQPLADLIEQLLAKEPGDRPANALALEKKLQKVARECEAKSEVALSLGKLQESLKEVVSKQSEPAPVPEPIEVVDTPEFDPLSVPAPAATLPPSAPAAIPRPMPHRGPAAKQPQKPAPASTVSPVVWMGAGVLGTLLLVLGIFWMVIPDQGETYVVTNPNPQNSNKQPQRNSDAAPQQPARPSPTSDDVKAPNQGKSPSTQTPQEQPQPAPEPRASESRASHAPTSSTESNRPLTETPSEAEIPSEESAPTESSNTAEESMPEPDLPGQEEPVDSSESMDTPTDITPVETVEMFISNVTGIGADTT